MPLRWTVGSLVVGLLTWLPIVAGAQTTGPVPLEELSEPVPGSVEEAAEAVIEATEAASDVDTAIEVGEVDGAASGGTTADSTDGPAHAGGGSGGTKAAAQAGGRRVSRSSPSHDQRAGAEHEPSYRVSPLVVSKTNDADENGVFSDSEAASRSGSAVTFRVEITNTGNVGLTITDVQDSFEEGPQAFGVPVCDELIAVSVPAKATVSCSFTLQEYAPEEGEKVNTVHVTTVETAHSSTRALASDTSTVLGSDVTVLGKVATNPLATTGAQILSLVKAMLGLVIGGSLLVAGGRLREEAMLGRTSIDGAATSR